MRKRLLYSLLAALMMTFILLPASVSANSYDTADPMVFGGEFSDFQYIANGNETWYRLDIPSDGEYELRLMNYTDISLKFELSSPDLSTHYYYDSVSGGSDTSPNTEVWTMPLSSGTYYLCLKHNYSWKDETIKYKMKNTFVSYGTNDVAAYSFDSPQNYSFGTTVTGLVGKTDHEDWFRFVVNTGGEYTLVSRSFSPNSIYMEVRNDDSSETLWSGTRGYDGALDSPKVESDTIELQPGTYYLKISRSGDYGSGGKYSFVLNVAGTDSLSEESGDSSDYTDQYYGDTTDLSNASISLAKTSYTYTGTAREPAVIVTIDGQSVSDYDYSVSYSNNVNAGTAKAIITDGAGNTFTRTFKIKRRKLVKKNMWISDLTYNGKYRKPTIHFYFESGNSWYNKKLKPGKQYKIVKGSKKFKKVRKYTITVQGKGNYYGKVKMSFTIRPANPKVKTIKKKGKKVSIKWNKVKGASGYCIETYNKKRKRIYTNKKRYTLKADSDYYVGATIYSYKKVKGKKILSKGRYYYNYVKPTKAPKFTVERYFGKYVIKFKDYGNYMVEFSTNKSFKYATGSNQWSGYTSELTRTLASCRGKTEYFRVRRYTTSPKGTIQAGPWSKTRKVTVY